MKKHMYNPCRGSRKKGTSLINGNDKACILPFSGLGDNKITFEVNFCPLNRQYMNSRDT